MNECAPNQITLTGPRVARFDLSAVKRITIKGRVNAEFRAELLNAFNTPWFTPVMPTAAADLADPTEYRITGAGGSRAMQLVFRLNY